MFELEHFQVHEYCSDIAFIPSTFDYGEEGSVPHERNITAELCSLGLHHHDMVTLPGDVVQHAHPDSDPPPKDKLNMSKHGMKGDLKNHDFTAKE